MIDQVLAASPDIAPARLRLFGGRSRELEVRGRTLRTETLEGSTTLDGAEWLVLHAGLINQTMATPPQLIGVRAQNDRLLADVQALAQRASAVRLVLFSSGAASRPERGSAPRRAYAAMKAEHERELQAWSHDTGVAVLLPRLFNIGGPYITHAQSFALGDFILTFAQGRTVEIAKGEPVFRSFVHVLELAATVMDMALDPRTPDAPFDVTGNEIIEIGALAERVAQVMGLGAPAIRRDVEQGGSDWYVGDGQAYQEAVLRAVGRCVPLGDIIADTADYVLANR